MKLKKKSIKKRRGEKKKVTKETVEKKPKNPIQTPKGFIHFPHSLLTLMVTTLAHPSLLKLTTPAEPVRPGISVRCKTSGNDSAFQEKKKVSVDYDQGKHEVSTHLSGLRKDDIPKRYRLRVQGDRFQKDWALSEVVDRVSELTHWEDINGVLNHWVGRFARKNFPLLIRVISEKLFFFYLFLFC